MIIHNIFLHTNMFQYFRPNGNFQQHHAELEGEEYFRHHRAEFGSLHYS